MPSDEHTRRTLQSEDIIILVSLFGVAVLASVPIGHVLGVWTIPKFGASLVAPVVFVLPLGIGLSKKFRGEP